MQQFLISFGDSVDQIPACKFLDPHTCCDHHEGFLLSLLDFVKCILRHAMENICSVVTVAAGVDMHTATAYNFAN